MRIDISIVEAKISVKREILIIEVTILIMGINALTTELENFDNGNRNSGKEITISVMEPKILKIEIKVYIIAKDI